MQQPNNKRKSEVPWTTSLGKQARGILKHTSSSSLPPTKKQHVDMAVPSEDNISMLQGVTNCSRETAIKYLKAKNNNVDQAMNAYFDGDDLKEDTWDEAVWDADRNDATLRPLGTSTAPTRGPSPAGSLRQPASREQEDADLNAAMMASYSQEQGVIRADGSVAPFYGPEHNPNQWALVKATPITREVMPDVDALDRRADAMPRLLKPSADYLPSFLTICHAIPAVRNLFLVPDHSIPSYGYEPDWWKGHDILLPRIVHTSDGSHAEPATSKYDDFLAELQRLIAFLDFSNRAYATTTNIEKNLQQAQGQIASERTNITSFLGQLAAATAHNGKGEVEQLFATIPGSDEEIVTTPIMEVIHLDIEGEGKSLYHILDNVLWDIDSEDEPEDRYLAKLPGVMVLKLQQRSSDVLSTSVKAPDMLFMDKYLKENLGIVKPTRDEILHTKTQMNKIQEVRHKLQSWNCANRQIDAYALLADAQAQFVADRPANGYNPDVKDIAEELDKIISNIQGKLMELELEMVTCQETLAELSEPPGRLRQHAFTLVGVSTKLNTTYVLRPRAEDEEPLLEHDVDDETPPGMQWWRLEYSHNGMHAQIHRTKLPSHQVQHAIENEHKTALLVYASQQAIESAQLPLTTQLQQFVQQDNEQFARELAAAPPPAYDFQQPYDVPVSSIERKMSMDSLAAHHDSPDMGSFDADPTQHATFNLGYGPGIEYDDAPLAEIPPPEDPVEMMEVSHADNVAAEHMEDVGGKGD